VDFCPVVNIASNRSCRGTSGTAVKSTIIGETIGHASRCIEGTLVPTASTPENGAYCLEVTK
jgi:hypothetical protein